MTARPTLKQLVKAKAYVAFAKDNPDMRESPAYREAVETIRRAGDTANRIIFDKA